MTGLRSRLKSSPVRVLLTTTLCCLWATQAFADLRYTVRVTTRKVAPSWALDSKLVALGTQILKAAVPDNSVEMTVTAGDRVARVTWNKAMPGLPAGAALIQRADGSRIVLDPARQVFWRAAMPDAYALSAADRPVVTAEPQTRAETVTDLPALRSRVEISIPFPEARNGMMVTGTPTNLPLQGDLWVTDSFAAYASRQLRVIHGLAHLGLDLAPPGTLVLRNILRGPLFGETELESIVIAMTEEELPDTLFVVPGGFKEVPAPRIKR